ncbi:hypothetical protein AB0L99_06715 [Streptomyces sp. NPDC051954]
MRGFAAAVVAVAALLLAANTGPAKATDAGRDGQVQQVRHAG